MASSSPPQRPARPSGLYFAFGSNLHLGQMAKRCPESRYVGVARLHGWRYQINNRGYANVVFSHGSYVEGLVYRLSPTDEANLDRNEGVSTAVYEKCQLEVELFTTPIEHVARAVPELAKELEASEPCIASEYKNMQRPVSKDGRSLARRHTRHTARYQASVDEQTDNQPGYDSSEGFQHRLRGQFTQTLVYLSHTYVQEGKPWDEYIDRMNAGIIDARKLGMTDRYIENCLRRYIKYRALLTDMPSYYHFTVVIEAIVEPHNKGRPVRESTQDGAQLRLWYGKLAAALRNREGTGGQHLKATAEPNIIEYRKQTDRHLQWWITWDGSLVEPRWPSYPGVPLKAVSRKLQTNTDWEDEIEAFWSAMRAVFHAPRRSPRCGSHVHVSPKRGYFNLKELQAIAFAVVWYDDEVQQILHRCRRDSNHCRRNRAHSRELRDKDISASATLINNATDKASLVSTIQGWNKEDRRTLWNFHNVTPKPNSGKSATGSVEFRGERCLRGPVRTKRWIAFAIAFVILAIKEFPLPLKNSYKRIDINEFWERLRAAAASERIEHLPARYDIMNDSSGPNITDEIDDHVDPVINVYTPQSAGNASLF